MSNVNTRTKLTHFLTSNEMQMVDFIAEMSDEHKAYLLAIYTGDISLNSGTRVYVTMEQALSAITEQFNKRVKNELKILNLFVYTTGHKLIDSYQVYRRTDVNW